MLKHVQTIEKTGKKLKAQQLISLFLFAAGFIVTLAIQDKPDSLTPVIFTGIAALGLGWYIIIQIKIWWHHG